MKTMTVWGVGPKWGALTVIYGALSYILGRRFPALLFPEAMGPALTVVGLLFVAVGLPFYLVAAKAMFRGVAAGKLVTAGPYGACRHPIYGAWIVFVIPGIELLLHSWFGLSTSFVAWAMLRFMAKEEESYLSEKFGESYRLYRKRTPFVLPYGWLQRRPD